MLKAQTKVTHIDLLRHGECEGGRIFRGSTDVALNDLGLTQMNKALARLSLHLHKPYHAIVSSPLKRCHDFAAHVAKREQCHLHSDHNLAEMFFGDWEGKSIEKIYQTEKALVDGWYRNPLKFSPPKGERSQDFYQRVDHALKAILQHFSEKHILVVCHAGVIRMIIARVLNIPLDKVHSLHVPYACISRISVHSYKGDHFFQLDAHNIPH